jgi:5-(carboxyamino)imidazole ribonucleotide mutase
MPVMQEAIDILKGFDIETEVDSFHIEHLKNYLILVKCPQAWYPVLIAGAGGAAHLPGMVASMSPLPVIGVPVKSSNLLMVGIRLSLQMPGGVL